MIRTSGMDENDPMMALLMGQVLGYPQAGMAMGGGGGGGMNVEGMSYEQILQAFGDGSENRGAEEATISSLPTSAIKDVEKDLPINARQCLICLEDFKNGDVRKTMPCLHGFHEDCLDRWLRTNGSCPICKHSIND